MTITTTYKTNASGRGQIIAKSGGKQKTINFDASRSVDQNHGDAAGEWFLKHSPNAGRILVHPESVQTVTHTSNDSGTVHRFTVNG